MKKPKKTNIILLIDNKNTQLESFIFIIHTELISEKGSREESFPANETTNKMNTLLRLVIPQKSLQRNAAHQSVY